MPKVGNRVEIIKKGKVVATAQNLEVFGRYARKPRIYVKSATATRQPGGKGLLRVKYSDGAHGEVIFASYNVLKDWLDTKRKRSGW